MIDHARRLGVVHIQFETVDVMRVLNGKLTEHWGVANLFCFMQQLGAWPTAAQA